MKRHLEEYKKVKGPKPEKKVVTSIYILKSQKDFVDESGLNLSEITRDAIEDLRKLKGGSK